ncbi:MAG: D-aminoacyl-tRNA deacylase, partial [Lachnospiraceae bacterium]|nr:D-aminoacyl-tRNA deacylase [Lachnospiraceae bacterium]
SPKDADAQLLIVSQFTLYADVSSRRPGFTDAARPDKAIPLYELVIEECQKRGFDVQTGEFGADMKVSSVNDGPVTIIIEK